MARTLINVNDPKAVKKYSGLLWEDVAKTSYWTKRFMGEGEASTMPIQRLNHLENDAGEQITFDLVSQLRMQPIEGDDVLENKEEGLAFFSDTVYIDQMRGGVNTGGRMTRKRTLHDLRQVARRKQSEWWARVFDELFFMYISGARGVNADFVFPASYAGFANNTITAPDTSHIQYAGNTSKATLAAANKMSLAEINKAVTIAKMMAVDVDTPKMVPINAEGEMRHVCVMNPYQSYDVRTSTTTNEWLDIQKNAGVRGGKNPIFTGSMGIYNNVVLHEHENIIRFGDYGENGDVSAARALFLGAQAAVIAFGSPGTGLRFDWHEETRDNGNQVVITTASIFGLTKVTFNGKDFGVYCIDTAAAAPTS